MRQKNPEADSACFSLKLRSPTTALLITILRIPDQIDFESVEQLQFQSLKKLTTMLSYIFALLAAWLAYLNVQWLGSISHNKRVASQSGLPIFFSWLVSSEIIFTAKTKCGRMHVNDASYIFTHKLVASLTRWIPQDQLRKWLP